MPKPKVFSNGHSSFERKHWVLRTQAWPSASIIWLFCIRYKSATTKPGECTANRLRSARKPSDRRHPEVATRLSNLAELYRLEGQAINSEPLYRRALDIRRLLWEQIIRIPPTAWIVSAATTLTRRSIGMRSPSFAERLTIREKSLGAGHPDVARSLKNLAAACYGQKRYVEAESLYRRALAILEKSLGPAHPEFAASLENHAETLRKLKRKEEAIEVEGRVKGLLARSK